jgi:transcriptional regulator with XRE-family HTH domain
MNRNSSPAPVGRLLRDWRQRRHLSQLDLAVEADISTRHLSFLETGRSRPSREMVLRLAELLEVPLRERNGLLHSAGFAPAFQQRALDDPDLDAARRAMELILAGHEPYPAVLVDRHWNLVSANQASMRLMAGIDVSLMQPPVNVMRMTLHPKGLASRIDNFAEWRAHVFHRLRRQIEITADPTLAELFTELQGLELPPGTSEAPPRSLQDYAGVVVPMVLNSAVGKLAFFSTITVFGTPVDITLSELALEAFFPADATTAEALRTLAASAGQSAGSGAVSGALGVVSAAS